MSFFFTKPKAKKRPAKAAGALFASGATPSARIKSNAPTLHRLGCKACPMNTAKLGAPKMAPTLARETLVYFLGEAPGRYEDTESGKPLTGPANLLLHECIPDGDAEYTSFDTIMNCHPPKGRHPQWNEIECCRPRRWKWIEQTKPKLVVGLGIEPLKWMLNSVDMPGMRGRVFAVKIGNHSCWFMPTYDPKFVLDKAFNKKKPLHSQMGHCFRMDLQKAYRIAAKLKAPKIDTEAEIRSNIQCFDGSKETDFQNVIGLLNKVKAAPVKAVDLETKGLRPFAADAAIMSVAFSFGDTNFAFALNHPKTKWNKVDLKDILFRLENTIKDDTIKVAHNAPFELEWFIWLFGKEVANHAAWECTQMQAHFLDERKGKGSNDRSDSSRKATYQKLDFLCKLHFGITYKSLFKLNKKDMSLSDLGETLIYNGVDTKYDLRLFYRQEKLLKEQKIYDAYLEALPRQVTMPVMQTLGIMVDQTKVGKFQKKLEDEIAELRIDIADLKVVKAFIKDHKEFAPSSDADVVSIFRDYLKFGEVSVMQEGGTVRYSADKNILSKIDHPLAGLILEFRNRAKLKSTYVDILKMGKGDAVYPDGKVHCNFNTTFAETGRTSSDDPNMQNFPQRKDAWVREQIVAEDGHVLLAFDYGQLEGCTAAMCSKDKVLIKALWEDYDIHMEWAIKAAERYPAIINGSMKDPNVAKPFRSLIKNKLVFPAMFGAQDKSIAGYLNIPEDVVSDLMDEFWSTFHGLKHWQEQLMKKYYECGWVDTFNGRRHRYPLSKNQAINYPIQGLACDIVCDGMNKLSIDALETGRWHLHPRLNIHDDLTFSVPDNDQVLEEAIEVIYRAMLSPPYDCVNVPLSVKASIGKTWFKMEEIGTFWSHKDL